MDSNSHQTAAGIFAKRSGVYLGTLRPFEGFFHTCRRVQLKNARNDICCCCSSHYKFSPLPTSSPRNKAAPAGSVHRDTTSRFVGFLAQLKRCAVSRGGGGVSSIQVAGQGSAVS